MNQSWIDMPCSVCGGYKLQTLPPMDGFTMARCSMCSHVFVAQAILKRQLDDYYGAAYYKSEGGGRGYDDYLAKSKLRMSGFRTKLARIERCTGYRGSLLDYGCAVGLFVEVAQEHGWSAKGYERSEWAVNYGRNVLGLDIVLATDDADPFPAASFDVVTLWDAIEHFDAPRQTIEAIWRWLKPGGLLAVSTINSSSLGARLAGRQWRHYAPPLHLQYFTRRSLLRLLKEVGFDIRLKTSTGVCLGSGSGGGRGGLLDMADAVLGHWRVRPVVSVLNLRDEIELIASKR